MYFPSYISKLKLKWERCLKIQVLKAMGREAFTEQNPTGHSWPICFYLEIYLDLDEKTMTNSESALVLLPSPPSPNNVCLFTFCNKKF